METKLLQFIKIGSACLFDQDEKINYKVLKKKALEIESDKNNNVLVVSGAIALGMARDGEMRTKEELTSCQLQGYASIGQIHLMNLYKRIFTRDIAQILVTENELVQSDSIKKLILENALKGRISLINYNDSIDFEELRKDNDTLAAEVMLACRGDRLIILGSDYDGFRDGNGDLIERLSEVNDSLYTYCNGKSSKGNGGFKTKLDAGKKIIECRREMIISNINYNLADIINGDARRTLFKR